jgi:hypothetical protein
MQTKTKLHRLASRLPLPFLSAVNGLTLATALAQPAAFTYQGSLTDGGTPANGVYDFSFTLHTASSGGTLKGGPLVTEDVSVSNGLFTVTLSFPCPSAVSMNGCRNKTAPTNEIIKSTS